MQARYKALHGFLAVLTQAASASRISYSGCGSASSWKSTLMLHHFELERQNEKDMLPTTDANHDLLQRGLLFGLFQRASTSV